MGHISKNEIEKINREVPIGDVAGKLGTDLTKKGKSLVGKCPFCSTKKSASLGIDPKTNLFECSECHREGNVVELVKSIHGISQKHAIEIIRTGVDHLTKPGDKRAKRSLKLKLSPIADSEISDEDLKKRIVDFYHEGFKQSPEAQTYLQTRGLCGNIIDQFRIGFADRNLGYRLPGKHTQAGAKIRGQLQSLGLIKDSGHETLRGCIVFPIFDESQNVVNIYGRRILSNPSATSSIHLTLNDNGIWNLTSFHASKDIILTQSVIDALSLWSRGHRNVVTHFCTDGISQMFLDLCKDHRIWIAYPNRDDSNIKVQKITAKLDENGIECRRILFPAGMDANDVLLANTEEDDPFKTFIDNAQLISRVDVDHHQKLDINPDDKKEIEITPDGLVFHFGDRDYRVRGLEKNTSYATLQVTLKVSRSIEGNPYHQDHVDLTVARQRKDFIKQAAVELELKPEVIKHDLGRVLNVLEERQVEMITKLLEPMVKPVQMSGAERDAALRLLKDANLLDRVLSDFSETGFVGEKSNLLIGYLTTISRKLSSPLALVIQSSSAAGKTSLLDTVLSFIPAEDLVKVSAMSAQALFYMRDLKNKVLAIVEEAGAKDSYALKLLQSEGEITIASTGKDPSGRLKTETYSVSGPTAIMLTTTNDEVDEELRNRCLVISVNEDRQQTQKVHELQRKKRTLEGLLADQRRQAIIKLQQNAQRLLRPLHVVNPYAPSLRFIDNQVHCRRAHQRYLNLIDAIALVHQHQREIKSIMINQEMVEYLEVIPSDIAIANQIAKEAFGDVQGELSGQGRVLLMQLTRMVENACEKLSMKKEDVRFTRRDFPAHWDPKLRIPRGQVVAAASIVSPKY